MTERIRFRCKNCGHRFEAVVLDEDERREARCERPAVRLDPRCLIPRFDGAMLSLEWKDALWDKFVTEASRPRTPSEQQYSDRKLRSRR